MSQVDDWADGYADSARDVNLYGPASANVPRSSVVSHQVRYQPPVAQTEARTNDTPMYTEDDARGAYVAPASGYRAPAGGGWDVNSSDANLRFSSESGGRRYARSKTKASAKPARKRTQKPAAPAKSADPAKSAATDYGSYKDQSDPLSQHILANGSSGEAASAESVVSAAKNATGQSAGRSDIDLSGLPRERSDMTPLPGDDWSPIDKAGAGINPYESAESLAAWKDLKLKSFPILPSEMSGGVPDASVTRFRQIAGDPNSTVADVLSAENEAKKAAIDEGMTMDDIAAFEKEVALNLLFAGAGSALNALRGVGGAARAASSTGNVWAEGGRAAAGDATAGAKAFEEALSRMNGGAVRGAPVEGTARSSFSSAGTTTGQSAGNRSFGFDLSPEEVARAKATHSAYVNGAAGRGTATGTEAAGSAGNGAAADSRSFRFDLSPEDIVATNAANAVARQQAANLSELRSVLIRSGMPDREIAAYMQEAGFYNNPEALQQAVLTVRKHGMSGLFSRSAEEAAAAGTYIPKYGRSPLEIWQQERAATEAANAKFRDMFGFSDVGKLAEAGGVGRGAAAAGGQAAGREAAAAGGQAAGAGRAGEAAADGGVSELANAGNAGRETAAGAATGSVSEGVDSASQQLIEHIRSGTLDEMERAWIEAMAAGAKAPGTANASTQAILNEARAAGILGRDAAGTAGTGAGSAAGTAGTGAGSAAAGGQAASREAIVAARDAAVAKLDPQLQDALANVRKSLANHNISPRQVLHELGSPTASDKDFYEIGRIFFEVGKKTHGAGLSPAEQAVADAYVKSYEARMSQGFTRLGRGLTHAIDENASRAIIDSIKNGKIDANSLEYVRGLARRSDLTPESQALVDAARSAGLIP